MTVALDNDTKLFVNKQPGGMFSVRDVAEAPGRVYYVGSNVTGATDSTGYGKSPDTPFATLDYAIGQTLADRSDTIYVLPGHSESTTTADTELFDLDVATTAVIGLGRGAKRPTFTLSVASATVVIGAAGCRISGLRIIGNISDLVAGLEIEAAADGSWIDHCYFADSASNKDMLIPIKVAANADGLVIADNHFQMVTGGEATDCINFAGGSDGTIIARNFAAGDWKTGGFINASAAASTGLIIIDNVVVNQDASAGLIYKGHASSTGLIARNMFAGNKANTEPINEITAMHVIENYMTDTAGASGVISATVTAWV